MRIKSITGEEKVTPKSQIEEKLPIDVNSLGQQLAMEKLKNIQKDSTINSLGFEVAKLKLEVIQLKGGGQ